MNEHLKRAYTDYPKMGRTFQKELEWYLVFGRVLVMPEIVCLVRECDKDDMFNLSPEKPNALFIEYLSADEGCLEYLWDIRERAFPHYDTVCYYRGLKSKNTLVMPYERLKDMLNRRNNHGR